MPPHKNQFMFDPHTKTKHFSTPTQKSCQFRSLRSSQVNFSPPHHKIKSILMPQHQNQLNFSPYTKNESISTPKLKPSQFPSLHRNQVKFDPPHKPSQFCSPYLNQFLFDPNTKIKSFSTPTPNSSQFRSLHWNQVNFDPPTHKRSQVRCSHYNHVIFGQRTKTKSILTTRTLTKSIHPHSENNSFSDRTEKSSQLRTPRSKTRYFRSIN